MREGIEPWQGWGKGCSMCKNGQQGDRVPVAYPHTLSGIPWPQPPMEVLARALITPRKSLCVQTQFVVTQLWP